MNLSAGSGSCQWLYWPSELRSSRMLEPLPPTSSTARAWPCQAKYFRKSPHPMQNSLVNARTLSPTCASKSRGYNRRRLPLTANHSSTCPPTYRPALMYLSDAEASSPPSPPLTLVRTKSSPATTPISESQFQVGRTSRLQSLASSLPSPRSKTLRMRHPRRLHLLAAAHAVHDSVRRPPMTTSNKFLQLLEQIVDDPLLRLPTSRRGASSSSGYSSSSSSSSSSLEHLVDEIHHRVFPLPLFQQVRILESLSALQHLLRRLERKPSTGSVRGDHRSVIRALPRPLNAHSNRIRRLWHVRLRAQPQRTSVLPRDRPLEFPWRPLPLQCRVRRLQRRRNAMRNRKSPRGLRLRQNGVSFQLLGVLVSRGVVPTSPPWWTRCISISHPPTHPPHQLDWNDRIPSSLSSLKTCVLRGIRTPVSHSKERLAASAPLVDAGMDCFVRDDEPNRSLRSSPSHFHAFSPSRTLSSVRPRSSSENAH